MILDLFAGPGGWSEGLRLLGVDEIELGVELDLAAVDTRSRAGHATTRRDVRELATHAVGPLTGLIASPPCQTFSDAGPAAGKGSLGQLMVAAAKVLEGTAVMDAAAAAGLDTEEPRTTLVLEPLRFIRDCKPGWVVMEEVPPVLPVWRAMAHLLARHGYSARAVKLCAADYGVPQQRKRAFLIARRYDHGGFAPVPRPTHHEYATGNDAFAELDLKPWITMAEALDLGPEPDDLTRWAWRRPATTVVRSFRPEIIAAPGYRSVGDPSRQNAPGSIEVTPEQLCVLQGIDPEYPFQGSDSKRLSLIGAVLPPPWAAAILRPLIEGDAA